MVNVRMKNVRKKSTGNTVGGQEAQTLPKGEQLVNGGGTEGGLWPGSQG